MYLPLAPCPSCSRHLRTTETICPFCKSALPESLSGSAVPGTSQRLSRAAAFAFTASLAVTGCGAGSGPVSGPVDGGASDAASSDAASTADAKKPVLDAGPDDDGGSAAEYGAAPVDAGPHDDGGVSADYGAPPITDGGNG